MPTRQNQTSIALMILRNTFSLTTSRYYSSATIFLAPQNLLHLLQLSIDLHSHKLSQQCHSQILANGFSQNAFLTTRLISAYATSGDLTLSKLVFHSVQAKNVYLWNSLINGHVKNHQFNQAIALFRQMGLSSLLPDDYTLSTISKLSGEVKDLVLGKLIHGKSMRVGFVSDIVLANSVMSMYSRCGEFGDAVKVFDEMPQRNVASFNVIISGCAALGNFASTLHGDLWDFFRRIQYEGFMADAFTVASLLPLCSDNAGKLDYGRELHCYLVKNGLDLKMVSDVHIGSSLIDMYSRSNKLVLSRRVFDQMRSRNIYVWTAMINGCVQNGAPEDALILLREMQRKDQIRPNEVSHISVIPTCTWFAGLMRGKQVHAFSIKMELNDCISLCNALIDMYVECGSILDDEV